MVGKNCPPYSLHPNAAKNLSCKGFRAIESAIADADFSIAWEELPPMTFERKLTMRRAAVGAVLAALFAAPAFALMVSDVDIDGDSLVSFDEMAVKYPDLTEDVFGQIDTSGDSLVDETELAAALEAGVIAEPAE